MYVYRHIEARSPNHCCSVKAINTKYYEYMCACILGLVIRRAIRSFSVSHHIVIRLFPTSNQAIERRLPTQKHHHSTSGCGHRVSPQRKSAYSRRSGKQ